MSLSNGATFAGFTILRLLGSGGMGEVYLAQHPRLPRQDALKLLPAEWSADDEYRSRFGREADLASGLWHPHIVGVHDRGEADGQLWISMDFVDGVDTARLLTDYPTGMPAHDAIRIVTAVASALDYAHKRGLLHRDVKPANIMVTHLDNDEQRIVLTDFGIARNVDDISGLTATNMTIGTVAYSAPEQLTGEEIDGRADQYALAATAYHLLTGSQLFPHSNPAVVIGRHLNTPAPALAAARPELAALDPALSKALAKNPDERFTSCSDFANALSEQTTLTRAAPIVNRKPPANRTGARVPVLVVLLALLLASAAFTTTQLIRPNPQPTSTRGQWQPYVDAASAYVTTMFTVTPATAESSVHRMLDMTVGSLHASLAQNSQNLIALFQNTQTQSTCTINAAGLEDLTGDKASVLVAARVQTSPPGGQASSQPHRLRLEVQKQLDGTLKIADLKYPDGGN
jgi:serine/threonine-protein kinase